MELQDILFGWKCLALVGGSLKASLRFFFCKIGRLQLLEFNYFEMVTQSCCTEVSRHDESTICWYAGMPYVTDQATD